MNYVLSFCKVTAASKLFSRNFYLPLLKPLTPKDALRTFRITGKWLLGAKIQHYIPVLLNHMKKRSKKEKNYGKIKHQYMEDFVYMMPILDPDNNEMHKRLCDILSTKKGKGAFVYTVDDKNYNLVVDAHLETAIRDGDVIDVLMSQGTDKILIKLSDFKKVPVEIESYTGDEKLFKGEGTTTKEDERHHHHGKLTMSLAKIFEDKERKEEKWEEELKRMLLRRKLQPGEGTKEWNEMLKAATANMDWKKYEKQAKRLVQYIEEPIVEYHISMQVDDFSKTKDVEELITKGGQDILDQLPTLQEIPEIINNLGDAVFHEYEIETEDEDEEKILRKICGVKVTLPSGKECFVSGQMIKGEEGDVFVPGQTIENEFGIEYAPGIMVCMDNKPTLINGLIVGDSDNKNPMFAPTPSTITENGHLSFTVTKEERIKYKPRKVPVRKVIKSNNQNPEDDYEEYYYDDCEDFVEDEMKPRKKLRRVVKKRKIIPPGCVYTSEEDIQYEEEEYSEYEEVDDDEDEGFISEDKIGTSSESETSGEIDSENDKPKELTLEEKIEQYRKAVDPRIVAHKEQIEEERLRFKEINAKITELIVNIETKTEEVKERLEELRNLTIVKEIDPISSASFEDAVDIANEITNQFQDANIISDILLTIVRRIVTFSDKNRISVDNINNSNNNTEFKVDERSKRCEKLKIALKTAMVAGSNVFKNRPKDEVSALKAIGTVLTLALQDQDKLVLELCDLMKDPMDRNEICELLLKELSQKHKKNKMTTLEDAIIDKERDIFEDSYVVEKLKDVLDKKGDIIGPAFKKISKNNPDLVSKVIELIKNNVNLVKNDVNATETLQDAIVQAVAQMAEKNFKDFVKNAGKSDIKDLISEAVCFSSVLGLNGVAQDLLKLPLNSNLVSTDDETCLNLLKRVVLIRKLAENDRGQAAALREIKKNPEFGKTNPRIRQLIRESAGLASNSTTIKNSKEIPTKLLDENNIIALEDFLIKRSRIELPVLVSRKGKEVVIPTEMEEQVLKGLVPYALLDEDGVSNIKAVKKFTNGIINNNKDFEKSVDEYLPFGANKRRNSVVKNEKWAEVPSFGKMDVRNRIRRLSNFNPRVTA